MVSERKRCTGPCSRELPLDAFGVNRSKRDGRQSWCKACGAAYNAEHKEEKAARAAAYRAEHREDLRAKDAARNATPERKAYVAAGRPVRNLSRHGITPEDRDAILATQGGICAICGGNDPGGRWGTWEIDHDHSHHPGAFGCPTCIRGILCHGCNSRLAVAESHNDAAYLTSPSVAVYLGAYAARREAAA